MPQPTHASIFLFPGDHRTKFIFEINQVSQVTTMEIQHQRDARLTREWPWAPCHILGKSLRSQLLPACVRAHRTKFIFEINQVSQVTTMEIQQSLPLSNPSIYKIE
jgi:hypothetical protein